MIKGTLRILIVLALGMTCAGTVAASSENSVKKVPAINSSGMNQFLPLVGVQRSNNWTYQTQSLTISLHDANTNANVAGAVATLTLNSYDYPYAQNFAAISVTSDANGAVTFNNLLPGSYHLVVQADGYQTVSTDVNSSQGSLNVALVGNYAFDDEFNENSLNSSIWQKSEGFGTITESNGVLSLSTDNSIRGNKYPFLQTNSPTLINSSYTVSMRFRVNQNGIDQSNQNYNHPMYFGLSAIPQVENDNFGNSPYINATTFWMRIQNQFDLGGSSFGGVGDTLVSKPMDNNWHIINVSYRNTLPGTFLGIPSFSFDGDVQTHAECNCGGPNSGLPGYIWIGSPSGNYYPDNFNLFQGLEVDYIRIQAQ